MLIHVCAYTDVPIFAYAVICARIGTYEHILVYVLKLSYVILLFLENKLEAVTQNIHQ